MACQTCKSARIVSIMGKTSDRCSVRINGNDYNGYVPGDMGVGGGDYIKFDFCLNCGQIQEVWPKPLHPIEQGEEYE